VLRMARENPVPAALVGLGLAWLLKERRQAEGTPAKHPLQQRTHRASQRARRAGTTLRSFFDDNPLIGAAGVLVLGATVGALLPRTQKEDRLMGQARDELVGRAEGALQETMTQKGEVTHGTERE
ncbi:MAG: hypothetical protein ACREU4_06805, partial [Burkholderiales bacterium]